MSGFRLLGQFTQFFLNSGLVNNGGSVTFYETDLTTLKNTYSDPALTVLNANPVSLDAAGRLSTDVWGSGIYGAVLKNSLGTTIQTLNNIQSGENSSAVIPTLVADDFLTNDGSNLLWQPVRQPPDPTGQAGKVLGTDGTAIFWQSNIVPPSPANISVSVDKTLIADTTNPGTSLMIMQGTGVAPPTGAHTTAVSVTFPTAFNATPRVYISPTGGGVTPYAYYVITSILSVSGTGFQVGFNVNEGGTSSAANIISDVNFQFLAIGTVTTP